MNVMEGAVILDTDQYFQVPRHIFNLDLTHCEFRIYIWLCYFGGSSKFYSTYDISRFCNMDSKSVIRARRLLSQKGLIELIRGRGPRGTMLMRIKAEEGA